MKKHKLALIGAGNIGGTMAHLASHTTDLDIILFDINKEMAQAKQLDISQAMAMEGRGANSILATNDYKDLTGADAIIITAGLPRKPGMSRDDLLLTNASIMKDIAKGVAANAPKAFVIVVTNPLDAMVWAFQHYSGLPHHQVVRMAGVLDTARFTSFLAAQLQVHPHNIKTMVLGGHGDSMVPLLGCTTVEGVPLKEWIKNGAITREELNKIIERTRFGGGEIVSLLKTGSAFYAPAHAALKMAKAYLNNEKRLLPCAAYVTGQFGYNDLYLGVPTIIGAQGAEKIVELQLDEEEKRALDHSAKEVETLINIIKKQG